MAKTGKLNFETLIEAYKLALESNPSLSLAEFCRSRNESQEQVEHWLYHRGKSVRDIKNEVLVKLGKIEQLPDKQRPSEIYERVWLGFKETLERGEDISLSAYCLLKGVNHEKMDKWVRRQGYSVSRMKLALGLKNEALNPNGSILNLSPDTQRFLGKTLKSYKSVLRTNPGYSMLTHCRKSHVDYQLMIRWMAHIGLSVRQIRKAVILDNEFPRTRKHVFVQFKPNGGSNGDKLTGVKILMADGSSVSVEECTVLSLCAFINQYNADQQQEKW